MGEMTVKGYAERRVECDIVKYTLEFYGEGMTIPEAVKSVNTELEHFLEVMDKNGIKADMFAVEDNETATNADDDDMPYCSTREISVELPISKNTINGMMYCIEKYHLNVELSEEHYCSDLPCIQKELLKEAVEDSRSKAELIAACAGQKIKGIKKVLTDYRISTMDFMCFEEDSLHSCMFSEGSSAYANNLSNPTRLEKEDVEIVWLIED